MRLRNQESSKGIRDNFRVSAWASRSVGSASLENIDRSIKIYAPRHDCSLPRGSSALAAGLPGRIGKTEVRDLGKRSAETHVNFRKPRECVRAHQLAFGGLDSAARGG
jgi:hypothetical protein